MPPPPPPTPAGEGARVRDVELTNDESISLVSLVDSREDSRVATQWLVQGELEWVLYNHEYTTGAMYRLLKRTTEATGSELQTLMLRSSSVSQGMITVADWVVVSEVVPKSARVLVLVPLELAVAAMELLGESPITKMVLSALGKLPDDWGSDEDEEDGVGVIEEAEQSDRDEDDTEGEGGAGNMDAADSSHAGHAGNADGDADDGD